jgi:hypothetical protein
VSNPISSGKNDPAVLLMPSSSSKTSFIFLSRLAYGVGLSILLIPSAQG